MSTQPARKVIPLPGVEAGPSDYLGPARVTAAAGAQVEVELPDGGAARARMALAYPYEPVEGDQLLVIGKGAAYYVIGVLEGRGRTALRFRGGVELRAEGGPIHLASDEGVSLEAPDVSVDARHLRVMAESVVEKLGSLVTRVRTLFSVRAREAETIVDEGSITRAKTATILTEETMSINGKQVHLG